MALSGTSMAAPQVSRVLAKMFLLKRDLTPQEAIEILSESAKRHQYSNSQFKSGGELDEEEAIKLTMKLTHLKK